MESFVGNFNTKFRYFILILKDSNSSNIVLSDVNSSGSRLLFLLISELAMKLDSSIHLGYVVHRNLYINYFKNFCSLACFVMSIVSRKFCYKQAYYSEKIGLKIARKREILSYTCDLVVMDMFHFFLVLAISNFKF